MAVQGPFKVDFGELFPLGAYLLSIEAQRDWDARNKSDDQARDGAGVRVWQAKIVDADPEAKQAYQDGVRRGELPPQPIWASEAIDLINDLPSATDLVGSLAATAEDVLARAGRG